MMDEYTLVLNHEERTHVAFNDQLIDIAPHLIDKTEDWTIITSDRIRDRFVDPVSEGFARIGADTPRVLTIPDGEAAKEWSVLKTTLDELVAMGCTRESGILAIGGGSVSDLAGVAAGLYMRGIRFAAVPTTLLSMVDASIGGKTAINFSGLKNYVGMFFPATHIIVLPQIAITLSEELFVEGIAEMLKTALLAGGELYRDMADVRSIQNRDAELLSRLIRECVLYKIAIVAEDPRDRTGVREQLNLGHTVGHALEAMGIGIGHGRAVAAGIAIEMTVAASAGFIEKKTASGVVEWVRRYGYQIPHDLLESDVFLTAAMADKKATGSKVVLSVIESPGKPKRVSMTPQSFERALRDAREVLDGAK